MRRGWKIGLAAVGLVVVGTLTGVLGARAQGAGSSYIPVNEEDFLRGIKDSPPYMHDGRLLTLDDTVEFFNLALGTQLTPEEKKDLVAFLRAL
jgi:hypothetical protein